MKNEGDSLKTPSLTSPKLQVLISLADRERHGYAIIKEVERRSGGKVRLSPGTLYPIIRRLLEAGLIEESNQRPDPDLDDERRRYYRLGERGREAAIAETERMEEVVAQARAKKLFRAIEDDELQEAESF